MYKHLFCEVIDNIKNFIFLRLMPVPTTVCFVELLRMVIEFDEYFNINKTSKWSNISICSFYDFFFLKYSFFLPKKQ